MAKNNFTQQPVVGAYADLKELLNTRFGSKELNLGHRKKAMNQLAGDQKSNIRGRGLDFAEVRAYQAGDDVRNIDWRVTARTGKPFTKVFMEERERPNIIAIDQRQSLFFGSRSCFKSALACHIGAIIAWSALSSGDKVGGWVFGNEQQANEVRPKRSRHAVLNLINQMMAFNQQLTQQSGLTEQEHAAKNFHQLLKTLQRSCKPGNRLFIISDGEGFEHKDTKKLLHGISQHCDVTFIYVYDPLEQELPPSGSYKISNGQQTATLNTRKAFLRKSYQQQFEQQLAERKALLNSVGIPMLCIATDQAPLAALSQFYRR